MFIGGDSMLKKVSLFMFLAFCALFISVDGVSAEQWVYQKMALTSHHLMSYNNDRDAFGRANLHIIEDVDTASSYSAGDGETRYAYCADVDTGGYNGTYVRSLINNSDYNGNGAKMRAILSSSYPFVTLNEMKALYREQMGENLYNANAIKDLTYQEAIYVSQAAVWTISNPNRTPFTYSHNMEDSEMLSLTHGRIGLTCDWSVTDPSAENYCYPSVEATKYEKNEAVVGKRVNAMVEWLLSLDGSEIDGSGNVNVNVVSKELTYDNSKDKNIAIVKFKVSLDNLTGVDSLSKINVKVTDANSQVINTDYKDGVYTITQEYDSNIKNVKFDISVDYSSSYGKKAYLYKSSGQQDLVSVENSSVTKNAKANVEIDNDGGDAEFSKVDITNQQELPGATLRVLDANGNLIEEWVSTNEKHIIKNLKEGKYTLVEIIAPEGYVTANSVEFEVKKGEVTQVTMIDDVTKVLISKKDFTTEEEVVGAKLQIKDKDGNVIYEWISGTEPYYIEKLPVGKYTLVETVYPNGYEEGMIVDGVLVSEYDFEVANTGEIQTIDVYNRASVITDVPNTGIHTSITLGTILIITGSLVVFISRKKRLN